MQSAEKIRADVVNAYDMMGQNGAERSMGDALRWLDGVADKAGGTLEAPMAALGRAMVELDDAMSGVADALDTMAFNPFELEEAEERLFAIRALARKHDVAPDDLAGFADTLRAKLDALDAGETQAVELARAVQEAQADYDAAADVLTAARLKSASKLDKAVAAELAPLKMERAVFKTLIEAEDAGPEGRRSRPLAGITGGFKRGSPKVSRHRPLCRYRRQSGLRKWRACCPAIRSPMRPARRQRPCWRVRETGMISKCYAPAFVQNLVSYKAPFAGASPE